MDSLLQDLIKDNRASLFRLRIAMFFLVMAAFLCAGVMYNAYTVFTALEKSNRALIEKELQ